MAFLSCMGLGVVFMNLPPVLPSLKAAYNVTNASIAFLVTSLVLAHAAVQIPAGLMTDQIGPKKTLIASLGIIFLSTFACVFNNSYTFVLVMRFLSGIGTGFAFNSGLKYASIFTAENRRGMMQGIFGGSFSIGGIIPFFLMPFLAGINWKFIYLASSAFFVFPITCLFLWGKEVKSEYIIKLSQFKPVFKSRSIWILGFMHAIFFGGVLTLGTWFSAFAIFTNPRQFAPYRRRMGGSDDADQRYCQVHGRNLPTLALRTQDPALFVSFAMCLLFITEPCVPVWLRACAFLSCGISQFVDLWSHLFPLDHKHEDGTGRKRVWNIQLYHEPWKPCAADLVWVFR
jgi:MFS family permease